MSYRAAVEQTVARTYGVNPCTIGRTTGGHYVIKGILPPDAGQAAGDWMDIKHEREGNVMRRHAPLRRDLKTGPASCALRVSAAYP